MTSEKLTPKIPWPQQSVLSHQCFDVDCANCDNKNRDGKPCKHYCHTPSADEIVEKLAKCITSVHSASGEQGQDLSYTSFDRAKATAILREWQKRITKGLDPCCDNEERTFAGGCKNCGDPSL